MTSGYLEDAIVPSKLLLASDESFPLLGPDVPTFRSGWFAALSMFQALLDDGQHDRQIVLLHITPFESTSSS